MNKLDESTYIFRRSSVMKAMFFLLKNWADYFGGLLQILIDSRLTEISSRLWLKISSDFELDPILDWVRHNPPQKAGLLCFCEEYVVKSCEQPACGSFLNNSQDVSSKESETFSTPWKTFLKENKDFIYFLKADKKGIFSLFTLRKKAVDLYWGNRNFVLVYILHLFE